MIPPTAFRELGFYAIPLGMLAGGLTSCFIFYFMLPRGEELETLEAEGFGGLVRFVRKWVLIVSGLGGIWVTAILTYFFTRYGL